MVTSVTYCSATVTLNWLLTVATNQQTTFHSEHIEVTPYACHPYVCSFVSLFSLLLARGSVKRQNISKMLGCCVIRE